MLGLLTALSTIFRHLTTSARGLLVSCRPETDISKESNVAKTQLRSSTRDTG